MAAEEIGYASQPDGLSFWRYPDRGLVPDAALVARIADTWSAARSDWLLAPSPHEVHPDHRAACLAAIEAAAQVGATLGFYEIGQPQVPGVLIDVTAVRERKRRAMACFVSQLAGQRYDEHIDALNRCRAYTLGPAVSHAESLWFADPSDLAGSVRGIFAAQARVLARKLGL